MAALAVAVALALVVGGVVGRSIVPSPAPSRPAMVRFSDTLTDVSISYPATWVRRAPKDQAMRLVVSARDASAGLSISVRKTELDAVSEKTLGVVRPLTDDLLRADDRITTIGEPVAVKVGGLPGYRYGYTYRTADGGDGAHIHYFLFKAKRLIQIVMQVVPASRLSSLEPTFHRIAGTFQDSRR